MAKNAGKQQPPSLDEFSKRLDAVRGEKTEEKASPEGTGAAMGRAFRVASELLAALFVGGVLGLGLDKLAGTQPWLLLAGLGLGFAAGIRNVSRALKEMSSPSSDDG